MCLALFGISILCGMLEPRFSGVLYLWLLCGTVVPMVESAIGVNWGTISSHRLKPTTVVDLLRENKISKVKLFEADSDVLRALMGSGIQVMVGIPNEMLPLLSSSPSAADLWVRQNVSAYVGRGGADIRCISNPFLFQNLNFCLLVTFRMSEIYFQVVIV